MRRARLVIHAGTHKTGTTFIQNSLAAASPRLRRHGIFYPVMGPAGGQHGLTTLWAPRMRAYASPAEAEVGWQAVAEEAAANRSANPLAVWAANMVSGERVATRPLLARCQRLVAHHAPGPASLWEPAERQRIVEHFAPLNAAFEARVRARQPDFALTPHALEAERVSRGALDVRFWNHLARDIYNGRLPEAA